MSDGKRVVSGSPDGSIAISDLSAKGTRPLITVKKHSGAIHNISLTADEKILISCGTNGEILAWDFSLLSLLHFHKSNAEVVYSAELIENTDLVFSTQSNG